LHLRPGSWLGAAGTLDLRVLSVTSR
jgi:hypothetical protein